MLNYMMGQDENVVWAKMCNLSRLGSKLQHWLYYEGAKS